MKVETTNSISAIKDIKKEQNKEHTQQNQYSQQNQKMEIPNMVENTEQAVDMLNETVQVVDKRLEFEVHETLSRTMVRVLNKETEEIIREIPPEEILDLVGNMLEMVGIIVDKKV
ncbi:flagellar protein FlaG [Proteinivorax tanatarense]|uniref:Flagellar protein FlaG n=1 Tax=Proteinivorax tanatarense TaxID=1260629 RepID=A0AAU7VMT4_9FIRM